MTKGEPKENLKIKVVSEIVSEAEFDPENGLGPFGVSKAVHSGGDEVYLLGVDSVGGKKDLYMEYNLSSYDSKVLIKKDHGLPMGDPLSSVQVGNEIFTFGEQIFEENGDCHFTDKIFKFDMESNELTELDTELPVDKDVDHFHFDLITILADGKALLFLDENLEDEHLTLYTFDPKDHSIKKQKTVTVSSESSFWYSSERDAVYAEDYIYFFVYDDIYRFDPEKYNLKKMDTKLPTEHPEAWRRSAVYTGEEIYIIGGGGYSKNITDEIIRYDPDNGKAERLDITLPEKLHGCNLVCDGKYIYIFGAKRYKLSQRSSPNAVWRFNYQDLEPKEDYPGIQHEDSPPYLLGIAGIAVFVSIGGAVYFWRKRD